MGGAAVSALQHSLLDGGIPFWRFPLWWGHFHAVPSPRLDHIWYRRPLLRRWSRWRGADLLSVGQYAHSCLESSGHIHSRGGERHAGIESPDRRRGDWVRFSIGHGDSGLLDSYAKAQDRWTMGPVWVMARADQPACQGKIHCLRREPRSGPGRRQEPCLLADGQGNVFFHVCFGAKSGDRPRNCLTQVDPPTHTHAGRRGLFEFYWQWVWTSWMGGFSPRGKWLELPVCPPAMVLGGWSLVALPAVGCLGQGDD